MTSYKFEYCVCPDFLYKNGKCAVCGNWIDDPKEYSKSKRNNFEIQSVVDGECDCLDPSINLDSICQKCLRKVVLIDPVVFFKESSGKSDSVQSPKTGFPSTITETPQSNQVFCTNCGVEIEIKHKYCASCGQANSLSAEQGEGIRNQKLHKDAKANPGLQFISKNKGSQIQFLIGGLVLFLIIAIVVIARSSGGGSPGGGSPSGGDGGTEGRWVTKCRSVMVPNPNYPGDQVPLSERIGIPKFFTEQQCTDVYIP